MASFLQDGSHKLNRYYQNDAQNSKSLHGSPCLNAKSSLHTSIRFSRHKNLLRKSQSQDAAVKEGREDCLLSHTWQPSHHTELDVEWDVLLVNVYYAHITRIARSSPLGPVGSEPERETETGREWRGKGVEGRREEAREPAKKTAAWLNDRDSRFI